VKIKGTIDVLDSQYGNIWTNIPAALFNQLKVSTGDTIKVTIYHLGNKKFEGLMPYTTTFAAVAQGKPLLYLNSLMQVSFALNQDNFSAVHHVYSGNEWKVEIEKKPADKSGNQPR
jgi:S-adenosylmethionine hydrolase